MFCLLLSCRAARGRPKGGRREPQKGFAFARFPLSQSVFGTARSRQGRAGFARRSEPLTARTVLEHRAEGKAGRGSQGVSPWRGSGAAPRAPYRARFLRAAYRIASAPSGCLRQYEVWKVLEHPVVLQRSIDVRDPIRIHYGRDCNTLLGIQRKDAKAQGRKENLCVFAPLR